MFICIMREREREIFNLKIGIEPQNGNGKSL